jgi:DtxR family transcriptional regulator, Mn-dependent transcriptional regulator
MSRATHEPVEHHPPLEEYLQVIESLSEEGAPVIQARIAKRLGRSAPSVSAMLDRLSSDGYIDRHGRQITLTEQGQAVARSVIRKHRLAERLLVDVIGLPWHLVHIEAGRWEHVISAEVEGRIIALLDDPGTCPHGNPIPGSSHLRTTHPEQMSVADAPKDTRVRFERISEELEFEQDALRYLDDAGFIPGVEATVRSRGPDGTVMLEIAGTTIALGPALGKKVFVVAA